MSGGVVVFDTEYTSWEGAKPGWDGPGQFRELIQIAAIRLMPGQGWKDAPTFDVLVRPVLNPRLSGFITALTGVTQADVDDKGVSTTEALAAFQAFIGDAAVVSNGKDIHVIAETCGLQHVKIPFDPRRCESMRKTLYDALGAELGERPDERKVNSGHVHALLNIKLPTAQVHNALHDVYSLAATCLELEKRGHHILPWPKN